MSEDKYLAVAHALGLAHRRLLDKMESDAWYTWHRERGIMTCWEGPLPHQIYIGTASDGLTKYQLGKARG